MFEENNLILKEIQNSEEIGSELIFSDNKLYSIEKKYINVWDCISFKHLKKINSLNNENVSLIYIYQEKLFSTYERKSYMSNNIIHIRNKNNYDLIFTIKSVTSRIDSMCVWNNKLYCNTTNNIKVFSLDNYLYLDNINTHYSHDIFKKIKSYLPESFEYLSLLEITNHNNLLLKLQIHNNNLYCINSNYNNTNKDEILEIDLISNKLKNIFKIHDQDNSISSYTVSNNIIYMGTLSCGYIESKIFAYNLLDGSYLFNIYSGYNDCEINNILIYQDNLLFTITKHPVFNNDYYQELPIVIYDLIQRKINNKLYSRNKDFKKKYESIYSILIANECIFFCNFLDSINVYHKAK